MKREPEYLPPGAALAKAYPREAFASDDGKLLPHDWHISQFPKNLAARTRTLEVAIPAGALRQGVNVLALETVRAPYDKVIDETKEPAKAAANGGWFDRTQSFYNLAGEVTRQAKAK